MKMSEKYEIKKLFDSIRVVNLEEDEVEGYWNMKTKEWFSIDEFMKNSL
jgi:hypothetical protein